MRAHAPLFVALGLVILSGCIELGAAGHVRGTSGGVVIVREGSATRGELGASSGVTTAPPAPPSADPTTPAAAGVPERFTTNAPGIPLALGENHTCKITPAGQVRCWGYNMQGQLGVGATQHPADGIVTGIGDASDGPVRSIAAGGYQTCALTAAGRVWCWGSNHEGQVGTGEVTEAPVRAPALVRGIDSVAALSLGDTTSCAITTTGELYCWGDNSHAQIDDSGRRQRPSPTRVAGFDRVDQVAVGNYHLCVLRGGRVTCRGDLASLGRDLAALDDVSAISAGWEHSCALRRGVPHCWGRSYLGVLGRGRVCPEGPTSATCDADTLYPPTPVPGVTGAVEIAGHDYHTCVRLESGGVTCWGNNQGHAFADDLPAEPWQTAHRVAPFERADALFVGGSHLCVLRDGVTSCLGNDWAGAVRGALAR